MKPVSRWVYVSLFVLFEAAFAPAAYEAHGWSGAILETIAFIIVIGICYVIGVAVARAENDHQTSEESPTPE
ncbi:MAG: hypothetical protein WC480_04545 [Patescibacteria group bacterium]